jgi:hypothetical protein
MPHTWTNKSKRVRRRDIFVRGLVLAVLIGLSFQADQVAAEEPFQEPPAINLKALMGLPSGMITAVSEHQLDIDRVSYRIHPKILAVTDEGQPVPMKELFPFVTVRYHLKDQQIDQLLVLMPR